MICVSNLTKIYPGGDSEIRALDGVNLTIEVGEFVAVVGQSGSGKSTLMNMLGCLDIPDSGEYLLNGRRVSSFDLDTLSGIRNREIGFVFQGFNLVPRLTALENVELPLMYARVPREDRKRRALEALERVGLADRAAHLPARMSGGQQQRTAIARAIVTRPSVLLADEPTGNLDAASGAEVLALITELNRSGCTVVMITHDPAVAARASRVVQIAGGRIVANERNDSHGPH